MSFSFHKPDFNDIGWLKEKLTEAQPQCCDFSVGNILGWSRFYGAEISQIEDCLVMKIGKDNSFDFPKGKSFEKALDAIVREYDFPKFSYLEKFETEALERLYPEKYCFTAQRDIFDYVYLQSDLAELSGKKYHGKRNHISYFEKNFNWSFEKLGKDNVDACIAMNEKWYTLNVDKDREGIEHEREVLRLNFNHFDEIGGVGGVLRVDGEVVAFTFGERLNSDTFVTHFEKAYSDIRGAYPMINNLFAKKLLTAYKYINREDDVGSEGLRSAKLSYHPTRLIEKFTAVKL